MIRIRFLDLKFDQVTIKVFLWSKDPTSEVDWLHALEWQYYVNSLYYFLNRNDLINYGIIISVKDNGKGIDPEIYPRLFTKFASKSFHGTGLGLFICKNIVEAHGGKIWGKNNNDGTGAEFEFTLPIGENENENENKNNSQ